MNPKIKVKGGYISRRDLLKWLYTLALERKDGKCKVTHIISFVESMEAKEEVL